MLEKHTHYFIVSRGQTEKAMAPHSSTLAWKIPWTGEPGGLQSMGSLRVRHDWTTSLSLFTFMHWRRKWQPTPVFFPGESQGWGSLVGCHLWGRRESNTTEATQRQQQQQGPEVWAWLYWVICVRACMLSHCSRVPQCNTVDCSPQSPLSMGFARQEHWSGLPCPPPEDLPDPGIEPHLLCLLHWQVGSLPPEKPSSLSRVLQSGNQEVCWVVLSSSRGLTAKVSTSTLTHYVGRIEQVGSKWSLS